MYTCTPTHIVHICSLPRLRATNITTVLQETPTPELFIESVANSEPLSSAQAVAQTTTQCPGLSQVCVLMDGSFLDGKHLKPTAVLNPSPNFFTSWYVTHLQQFVPTYKCFIPLLSLTYFHAIRIFVLLNIMQMYNFFLYYHNISPQTINKCSDRSMEV